MKKPSDAVEKEFNDGGIFFLDQANISDPFFEGQYIGVEVRIGIPSEPAITVPDFSVSILNRRDVALLCTDWRLSESGDQKHLVFNVFQRLPEDVQLEAHIAKYMSFLDLCFYAGNEAIPEVYGEDIFTKAPDGWKPGDIGWTMPSRFIDALIDALGKLDSTMLGGMIKEALICGPSYKGGVGSPN